MEKEDGKPLGRRPRTIIFSGGRGASKGEKKRTPGKVDTRTSPIKISPSIGEKDEGAVAKKAARRETRHQVDFLHSVRRTCPETARRDAGKRNGEGNSRAMRDVVHQKKNIVLDLSSLGYHLMLLLENRTQRGELRGNLVLKVTKEEELDSKE